MDTSNNSLFSQPPRGALSKAAASEYIGVSERYLDHLIAAGQLQKVKLGRKTVIRIVDLDKLLEQYLQQQPAANNCERDTAERESNS